MEKMKFIWDMEDKTGSFIVSASSVQECIKVAEKATEKAGAELVDWYPV